MKLKNIIMAGIALVASLAFTACQTEWPDTNPLNKQGVNVIAYGPNPVARGGQLRFMGTGLDQIKSVNMPGCGAVTDIEVVSTSDIRIVVPQTAAPGYITLKDAEGKEYQMEKALAFTEPVGFAAENAFAPNPVKPGQEVTISGEYLNLVQAVVLDGAEVAKFKEQSREKIVLVVPETAKTGKVTLMFVATGDTIANEVASKEKLEIITPSVKKIAKLDETKPGDNVVIAGENFDLITKVTIPSGAAIDFAFNDAKTEISFTLPADITPGAINVVAASGVSVPVATIGVALPKEVKIAPATGVREGTVITIEGEDLDVVTTVAFTTAKGSEEGKIKEGRKPGKLEVVAPAAAITGTIILNTAAGIAVDASIEEGLKYETLKPTFKTYESAKVPMGNEVVVHGFNLDLVVKATVTGGAECEVVGATPSTAKFTLPYANAETGKVILTMGNGEEVEIGELEISAPECCYVSEWPELVDDEPIQAGNLLMLVVENRDKLTNVEIDGNDCQFILNGDTKIYVDIPTSAGKKSKVKLISTNGAIEYAYAFKPNSEVTTILWKGMSELGWSGAGQVYLGDDGAPQFTTLGVKAGDQLRIAFTILADDWCAQIWEGHWGKQYDEIKAENYDLAGNKGYYFLTLTDEMIATMTAGGGWGGIVLCQGQSLIVTQLAVVQHIAVEEELWKGSAELGWSGAGQVYFLTDGGAEFVDHEVKAGMHLYIYLNAGSDWAVQLWEGHWGTMYGEYKAENYDLAGNGGKIDVVLTQAMIDNAMVSQGWGGIILCQGQDCFVTKITVM